MTDEVPLFLAFFAGLLSFLSPCVLPLIPSYLSILGGAGLEKNGLEKTGLDKNDRNPRDNPVYRRRLVWTAAAFVLGFSTVFIILGILISSTFLLIGGVSRYINLAAGIIVIILGINLCIDFFSFLNYEKRPFLGLYLGQKNKIHLSAAAAFIAGAAFGTGWTPCIGPVLTGILLMASQSGQTPRAVLYLALYSAGLALPFLGAAAFLDFFLKQARQLHSHLALIQRISGVILIIIGISILTGRYSAFNILIQSWIFDYIDWAETKALPFRIFADFLRWQQNF